MTERSDLGPFALSDGRAKTSSLQAAGAAARRNDKTWPQRVSILGATGSIGQSTLDLIKRNPERYRVMAVTAHAQAEALAEIARATGAQVAAIADPTHYAALKRALSGTNIEALTGTEGILAAADCPTDITVAAIVGAAGLAPTLRAVEQGHRIALANKECLVAAGGPFMAAVARTGAELIPIDSEHAGVFQCLIGADLAAVHKITITASGGPFRSWTAAQMNAARPEHALKHPNWVMGRKITIDSATLMNKGLELIEAHHLFACPPERLACIVHPQSIIHALVSMTDGSVMAQMGAPDMRTAIALSLTWPERHPTPVATLDLTEIASLTFEKPDRARFPCLAIAEDAMVRGGLAPAVMNAANEVAVEAFLDGRLSFPHIAAVITATLEAADARGHFAPTVTVDHVLEADAAARGLAKDAIKVLNCA